MCVCVCWYTNIKLEGDVLLGCLYKVIIVFVRVCVRVCVCVCVNTEHMCTVR